MIDIHCHLAPNISDGPESSEDSLAMLKKAAEDGVTHITAAAHYGKYLDELKAAVASLGEEAKRLGITLHPTFEYDFVHLDEVKLEDMQFVGPDCRYILLDFHRSNLPYSAPMRLFELMENNIGIVIVHPEKLFRTDMIPKLQQFVDGGIVLQVNAVSFLSDSPPRVRRMAHQLMRKGLVQVVASDAHRKAGTRRYALAEARKVLEKTYGKQTAELVLDINPQRILEDKPPFEMPVHLNWWEKLKRHWTGR